MAKSANDNMMMTCQEYCDGVDPLPKGGWVTDRHCHGTRRANTPHC